ncbi:MAG: carboxylating nicotinate-nucleotide diphosphorylase [Halobacteriales archaeon]|nr:carboxylating nicotinate-nucleotide diphosphorylase [Halobacteriales archaeon]
MPVDWIGLYLEEDLGEDLDGGDVTGGSLFPPSHRSRARLVARERAFLSGATHAQEVFRRLGAMAKRHMNDGQWVAAGTEILLLEGPTRGILAAERTALNVVARMSGIATATREMSELLARASCGGRVAGTRKTTPGFRAFEKEAIRAGGGDPHRMGLFDEAMVKDNHREAFGGGVAQAVANVKATHPGKRLTCEVESLEDALAAAGAGADWLLIDNQAPDVARRWADAVWAAQPQAQVEVSGGIGPDNVVAYGWADRISMGWLTQKAPAKDFSLEWVENL